MELYKGKGRRAKFGKTRGLGPLGDEADSFLSGSISCYGIF